MKRSTFLSLTAMIAFFFGIAMVFEPTVFFSGYGAAVNDFGLMMGRSLGSALFAIGAINWLARKSEPKSALAAILTGNALLHGVALVIDFLGMSAGTVNQRGWGGIVLHILLLIAFVYYLIDMTRKNTT